ncbi:MAG: hypothetical protein JSW28_07570 [Thermoplasmata archaeon]|nr:MAG: hypothetical protein JSW28_07570 [Thermoplasmata archaeon]
MAPWGRKKREAEESLASAKELIIKIKKRGVDTSQAERLYKDAKKALGKRDYKGALEGIARAENSAKRTYARGIKKRLETRISDLSKCIDEMKMNNLDAKDEKKYLVKAEKAMKSGAKGYKSGLKASKEGLVLAEKKLGQFKDISGILSNSAFTLRRIQDQSPDLAILPSLQEKIAKLEELKARGKIDKIYKDVKKLGKEMQVKKEEYKESFDALAGFEKVVGDAHILGAKIEAEEQLSRAKKLFLEGKFLETYDIALTRKNEIAELLKGFREAKHEVDMAAEKVKEAKSWGFSAFEAENALDSAQKALSGNHFEEAKTKAREASEKAGNIRERHKRSLTLINDAKERMEREKAKGSDIGEIESNIKDAENEFERGNYGRAEEMTNNILERLRTRE